MKVILKRDVDNLGEAGDIVDVADGYGNNYLMPKGLAMRATRGAVADAQAIRTARAKREARNLEEARKLKDSIDGRAVTISAKAGEDGTLYGSVGNAQVAEALAQQLKFEVDRRKIPLERPIKSVGEHELDVRLHRDLTATVRVHVVAEES